MPDFNFVRATFMCEGVLIRGYIGHNVHNVSHNRHGYNLVFPHVRYPLRVICDASS